MLNRIPQIYRGDTLVWPFFINDSNDPLRPKRYELQDGDKLYVGIREPGKVWEDSLIRKVYTNNDLNEDGDVIIRFDPKDTEQVLSGKYILEMKLVLSNEAVVTVYPPSDFWVEE